MKSTTLAFAGGLVSIASASPWFPQATVTVTSCPAGGAPGYTGAPGAPGQTAQPPYAVTVTVTETSTVIETTTLEGSSGSYSITSAGGIYTHLPPKPGMTTTWVTDGGSGGAGTGTAASTGFTTSTGTASGSKQTFHVQVGTFDGMVKFVPNNVEAKVGDVVEFDFLAKSHSLTQSEFVTPCTYNGGFDTGLNQPNPMNVSGLHVVPFTVSTEKPQWFYCKQQGPPNHCGKGMVFGLNPGNKMDQFIQNAIKQNGGLDATSTVSSSIATGTGASSTSTATSATTTVTVGLNGGTTLKFDPPFLPKVNVGDKLHFDFRALNHTLTESSLEAPCAKLMGTDVDTNFQNVNKMDIPNFKPFDLTITEDKPRFFYCKQANRTPNGHCGKGMVFAVNVDESTFDRFEKNAEATGLLPVPMRRRFVA